MRQGQTTSTSTLIDSLLKSENYPHPTDHIHLIETHISWVILTGPYAYKIKKPLDLMFLDFSTLEKRHHFCNEEIRLNSRLAPQLYIDVIAITGTPETPQINGSGNAIEYAVRMKQFPEDAMVDAVLSRGELTTRHLDLLADHIAHFHGSIDKSTLKSPYGNPENIKQPAFENINQIRSYDHDKDDLSCLDKLESWTAQSCKQLASTFELRKELGFVRECHGDMHLGNMTLLDDQITIFDCIEFNPNLYWIDVMSEIAFLVMDLQHRGFNHRAARLLNRYLEHRGDYSGLGVFRYYLVYRALVRAKVSCIRAKQASIDKTEQQHAINEFRSYLSQAAAYTKQQQPILIITHGFSGSGKTTHTQALLERLDAIRIRSDVERKRLYELPAVSHSRSELGSGIYTAKATERTYEHLARLAHEIITAGYTVIVDASFLQKKYRDYFQETARQLDTPFLTLHFEAEPHILRMYIKQRIADSSDASEANLKVLEHQLTSYIPLSPNELQSTITIDTSQPSDIEALCKQIKDSIA
jgi:hypothetical protein